MSARSRAAASGVRHLVVVLGDQLDAGSAALDGFEASRDAIWMAEVAGESEHVVSSQVRTALFLSAMRHFRDSQRALGRRVEYVELDAASIRLILPFVEVRTVSGGTRASLKEMRRIIFKNSKCSLTIAFPFAISASVFNRSNTNE